MIRIGVDIGNLYLKIVKIYDSKIVQKEMVLHSKNILPILESYLLKEEDFLIGFTGSIITEFPSDFPFFDEIKCLLFSVRKFFPSAKYILEVGANSSKIIELDEDGNLKNIFTNSVCAAGTGTFIDQQKTRMSLEYEEIEKWDIPSDEPPSIASRCTVFAKTDLINRQQEGYSKREMWAGLTKSMVKGVLNTLLKGKKIEGDLAVAGGITRNKFFLHYLKESLDTNIFYSEISPFLNAIGAAYLTSFKFKKEYLISLKNIFQKKKIKEIERSPPLLLLKSKYPNFKSTYEEVINEVEVRIHDWEKGEKLKVYLGIDIGSTSTKCVLMRNDFKVVADFYTRTKGEPIIATQRIFKVISEVKEKMNSQIEILGCGTTGSGRKLVGKFISADLIVNEITAHAEGALHFYPEAEVIFEIGGQDSKYIRLKNRRVYDCNMNYICSAGTGSFLEEQAKKLGFDIKKVSDFIMGISPPLTQERCTVFMEQDVERLLGEGFSKEEVMAACIYSVVHNYLNKVVGRRYIPKGKIFFQGATARNKALIAGFERICNREIVVSPFCHVMGALGAAILVKKKLKHKSKFRGFDIKDKKVKIWYENCNLCENNCRITYLQCDNEVVSFGYGCGREPEDTKRKKRKELALFEFYLKEIFKSKTKGESKLGKVYIPRALSTYTLFPFYKTFLERIGFQVFLSKNPDRETLEKGREISSSEFCLPVKIMFGIISEIIEKDGFIFLPWIINYPDIHFKNYNYFCPYVQANPAYIIQTFLLRGVKKEKFLVPLFDFTLPRGLLIENLYKYFKKFGLKKNKIQNAFDEALKFQRNFEKNIKKEGKKIIEKIDEKKEKFIVLFGRPYVIFSNAINLFTPLKLANFGIKIIPWNVLSELSENKGITKNMYWYYGAKILEVAEFIKEKENLYPVYLTCFSCGPDSFLLSYIEEIFKHKPFLILELDEHGGEAVFQTRIEAFYDVIKEDEKREVEKGVSIKKSDQKEIYSRTIWIPPMHPEGARLFAASFRRFGFKAKALPLSNKKHWETGRKLLRGSECLPCALTIGTFIEEIKKYKNEKHALFMPTSSGPCRFGQYAFLQKIIFEREGEDILILSPNSYDAYQGLPQKLRRFLWSTILIFEAILKCRNRIKPYERNPGETQRVYLKAIEEMEKAIEDGKDVFFALEKCINDFSKIETLKIEKPLVGVVGEIYVRLDPYANDDVIKTIEKCGGEAWVSPISEWIWYADFMARWRARIRRNLKDLLITFLKNKFFKGIERKIYEITREIIGDRKEPDIEEIMKKAAEFFPVNFGTESPLTIGRAIIFKEQGAKAVVNVSPFTCMPGNISQAIFQKISEDIGIPVINMFYDGQRGENKKLEIFLRNFL